MMRADGFEPSIDAEIVQLVRERSGPDRESVAVAALVYQTLAPNPALERVALELAQDERESPRVRCRAAEALRSASDEATLGLRLGDVSRQANYTVFSDWLNGMFQTTL